MLKKFREKWRLWEQALSGIDDLHGDYMVGLEKRLSRLKPLRPSCKALPAKGSRLKTGA